MAAVSIYLRRRVRLLPGLFLNLTKTGGSLSARAGRVTVNSRGRTTVRIAKGLTWRGSRR